MPSGRRNEGLSIGQLARQVGCRTETVHFYERAGLMPEPPRTAGGHRVYEGRHRRRMSFIRRSRELGFTLDQVRSLLSLVDSGAFTCAEVRDLTLDHLSEVRGKLADLKRLERVLTDMAAQCEDGSLPDCPIIEALNR